MSFNVVQSFKVRFSPTYRSDCILNHNRLEEMLKGIHGSGKHTVICIDSTNVHFVNVVVISKCLQELGVCKTRVVVLWNKLNMRNVS